MFRILSCEPSADSIAFVFPFIFSLTRGGAYTHTHTSICVQICFQNKNENFSIEIPSWSIGDIPRHPRIPESVGSCMSKVSQGYLTLWVISDHVCAVCCFSCSDLRV